MKRVSRFRWHLLILLCVLMSMPLVTNAQEHTSSNSVSGGGDSSTTLPISFGPVRDFPIDMLISGQTSLIFEDPSGAVVDTLVFTGDGKVEGNSLVSLVGGTTYTVKKVHEFVATVDSLFIQGAYVAETTDNPITWEFTADKTAIYEVIVKDQAVDFTATVSGGPPDAPLSGGGHADVVGDVIEVLAKLDGKIPKNGKLAFSASFSGSINTSTIISRPNNPPVLTTVQIGVHGGGTAVTGSVLDLVAFDATDDETPKPDLTKLIRWLKNGSAIPAQTGETLDGANFAKGDKVSLELVVQDTTGKKSDAKVSNEIEILNSAPGVPTIVLEPANPTALTVLTVTITPGQDPDNDPVQSIVKWFFDDVEQPDLANQTTIGPGIKQGTVVKVSVTSNDGTASSTAAEQKVKIGNSPPVLSLIPDQTVKERADINIPVTASDPDKDPLTFSLVNPPAGLAIDASTGAISGKIDGVPAPSSFFDVFVEVTDSKATVSGKFKLTVENVNRRPVLDPIGTDGSVAVDLAAPQNGLLDLGILAKDPDGDKLTYQMLFGGSEAVIEDAVKAFNASAQGKPSGESVGFSAQFAQAHAGKLYQLQVFVSDGAAGAGEQRFSISVGASNRPPTLKLPQFAILKKVNDPTKDVFNDDFSKYAKDADKDTLTFKALVDPLPAGATLKSNGAFEWRFFGTQPNTFVIPIEVNDGEFKASGIAVFTIADPNDAPILSAIGAQRGTENSRVSFVATAHDPDGDRLQFSAKGLPAWATFDPNTLTFIPKDAASFFDQYQQTFAGMPPFTASAGDPTPFEVTITVTDPEGASDSETVTVTIEDVNRPPVFQQVDPQSVQEDQSVSFPIQVSDPDGDKLSLTLLAGAGDLDTDTLVYTWDLTGKFDVAGTAQDPDKVVVEADDGKGGTDQLSVEIDVTDVNRKPVVTVEDQTVPEKPAGETSTFEVVVTDPDGDEFKPADLDYASVPDLPFDAKFVEGSILIQVAPSFGDAGTYDVTVSVEDQAGAVGRDTFRLIVTKTNRGPVANIGDFTIGQEQTLIEDLTGSVKDPDGDPVAFAFKEGYTPPDGLLVLPSGTLSWTPTAKQAGQTYTVEVTITDRPKAGTPISIDSFFDVSVLAANKLPTISAIAEQSVNVGEEVRVEGILAIDLDADELTIDIEQGPGELTLVTGITVPGIPVQVTQVTYTYQTQAEDAGKQFTVLLRAEDGRGGLAGESFIITIGGVAPILVAIDNLTLPEDTTQPVELKFELDAGATQPPNPVLSFTHTFEQNGRAPINVIDDGDPATYVLQWLPGFDQSNKNTEHKLVVTVTDGNTGFQDTEQVLISVTNVNRKPVMGNVSIAPAAPRGSDELRMLHTAPTDPDGDKPIVKVVWQKNGSVVSELNGLGSVPAAMTLPGEEWTVEATAVDSLGATDTKSATVTITDTPANITATHHVEEQDDNPGLHVPDDVIFTITYQDPDGTKPPEAVTLKVWDNDPAQPLLNESVASSGAGTYELTSNFPTGSYQYQASSDGVQSDVGSFTVNDSPHELTVPQLDGTVSGDVTLDFGVFDADDDQITVTILVDGQVATLSGGNPMTVGTGEHSATWESATDLPNANGESHTLTFVSVGSPEVRKGISVNVQNKALRAPFLESVDSPVPKVVDISGLKPVGRGVKLFVNGGEAGDISPNADESFTFDDIVLREGENVLFAKSYYTIRYFGSVWIPTWSRVCFFFRWNRCFYLFTGWRRVLIGPFERTIFSGRSNQLKLLVDSENPEVTILSPEEVIATRTPELLAFVDDKNLDPSTIAFKIDGSQRNATYNPETKMASLRIPANQPLGQGGHTFAVEAQDKAKNQGSDSREFTINVVIPDTSPPAEVRKSPTGTVTGTPVEVTVADSQSKLDPESRVFQLDGQDVASDYIPIDPKSGTIRHIADIKTQGVHQVMVSIADAKGNVGTYEWSFNVDNAGPTAPVLRVVDYTADDTITVTGNSEPGALVQLILNGESFGQTDADAATGAFSFLGVPLLPGNNALQAVATDAFGNVGDFSATQNVIRDLSAPSMSFFSPVANQIVGTLTPLITASIMDESGVDSAELLVNGVAITSFDYNAITGLLSYASAELPDETPVGLELTATDRVGHSRTIQSSFFVRTAVTDNVSPVIESVQFDGQAVSRGATVITSNPTPLLSGLVYDTDSGIDALTVTMSFIPEGIPNTAGSALIGDLNSGIYDAGTSTVNATLDDRGDGSAHTVAISAMDKNGNSSSFYFTFDVKTPDDIPTPEVSAQQRTRAATTPVRISNAELNSQVSLFANGIPAFSTTYTGEFSRDVALVPGVNRIYAQATSSGITKNSAEIQVIRDVDPPLISLVSPLNGSTIKPAGATVTVELRVADPSGVRAVNLSIQGGTVTPTITDVDATTKKVTADVPVTADGNVEIRATATDGVGNSSTQPFAAFFVVDTTPPAVKIVTPEKDGETVTNSIPQLVGAVGVADIDVNSIQAFIDGNQVLHSFSATDGQVILLPAELANGKHIVRVEAADLVGNSNSAERPFAIDTSAQDEVDPAVGSFFPLPGSVVSSTALNLLSFITSDTSSGVNPELVFITINGETFSLASLLEQNAAGNRRVHFNRQTGKVSIVLRQPVGGRGTVSLNPLELSQFERSLGVGQNSVSLQVTDFAGNSTTTGWSFTVVTEAPETPVLDIPAALIADATTTITGSVANILPVNPVTVRIFVNSVAVQTVSVADDGTFSVADVGLVSGSNTVDAIATDSAGNESNRSAAVSVFVDQVAPVVTVNDLPATTKQSALTVSGRATDDSGLDLASVVLVINGEAQAPVTDGAFSFDVTLTEGINTIVIEATDSAGNMGQSAELSVSLDTTLPTTAPANLVTAVDISSNAAKLTWQADAEAASYNVYRTTSGPITDATGMTPVAAGISDTAFDDFGATPGTTYFYAVTTVDSAGNEQPSVVSNSPNASLIPTTGGIASLPDQTQLIFGTRAIYQDSTLVAAVSIESVQDADVPALENALAGTTRKVDVIGQTGEVVDTFNSAVGVSIPFDTSALSANQSAAVYVLLDETWQELDSELDSGAVFATTTQPGIFRVASVTTLPAYDINADATVDILDLTQVGLHFGEEGTGIVGDVNADDVVDILDLTQVGLHFGETFGTPNAAPISPNAALVQLGLSAKRTGSRDYVELNVTVDDPGLVRGFQFDLDYDANLLEIVRVTEGAALKQQGHTYWLEPVLGPGRVRARSVLLGRAAQTADSQEGLARFILKVHSGVFSDALKSVRVSSAMLADSRGLPLRVEIGTKVSYDGWQVARTSLGQNYPNPFNPETWIPYSLKNRTDVVIRIHNPAGQLVRTLRLGTRTAGDYSSPGRSAYWDGRNNQGEAVASGTYFYTMTAGGFTTTRKMVILK